MTTETASLSGWDRALIAARWCRDKAAEFIVKFWLYVILWSVVGIAFTVLLYIDGKFSRGLAEGLEDIDPFSFQAMGWAYRLFAAAFLMAGAVCIVKGIKGALTFRLLGVFASVIVCLHAFGFGFQALQDRRDDALAVREVVALQANNSAEQIALLREQIETTRADRDARVTRLQASIDGIVSDGLNNDQLADVYRADQTKAEDEAKAKIDAAEREISRLASEGNTAKQNVATITADEKPWPALYVGMAQLFTWSKAPDDWAIYLCGVGFIIGWVLLAESLVIFLPERIYLMHLKDAEGREVIDGGVSEDVPPGHLNITIPQEEWDAMQEALKVHGNIKKGAQKGASTRRRGGKLARMEEYAMGRIEEVRARFADGMTPQQMARKWNQTINQFRYELESYVAKDWMDEDEFTAIFGVAPSPSPERPAADDAINGYDAVMRGTARRLDEEEDEAEPPVSTLGDYMPEVETPEEPEPPVAVADSPQEDEPEPEADDELSIPDEPKEWPMAPYEPPANDDPDKEEAA